MRQTKFVRAQLIIFSILTVIGLVVMGAVYVQLPAMFGIGRYEVTATAATGGLSQRQRCLPRHQCRSVQEVRLTPGGVEAELINSDYKIPADSVAWVKSVSAVGEQSVDLVPTSDQGPNLANNDVIPVDQTRSSGCRADAGRSRPHGRQRRRHPVADTRR